MLYECNRPITTNDDLGSAFRKLRIGLRYVVQRKGPLAVGINQAGGFARSRAESGRPDIQFHFGTLSSDQPGSPVHSFSGFTLSVCQLRPSSTGTVHVQSSDPASHPVIQPNYLSEEEDRQVALDGVKVARRLMAAPAIRASVRREYAPGAEVVSDADLAAFIRNEATTIFHPVGTCRMADDALGVVDHRLQVRGVEGLRVIDASIMPALVSGNTHAAAVMIGEKGADLILEDSAPQANRHRER